MNDFTKQELNYIEELLSEYYEYFEGEEDEAWKLHDKVKLMLDNYCEHESRGNPIIGEWPLQCKKCGEFYR